MTESSFKTALHRFDKSLFLERRQEDDGWRIMGVDAHLNVYTVVNHIPIGMLGLHIIDNLYNSSPHRNGKTVDELLDPMDKKNPCHVDQKAKVYAKIEDAGREARERYHWLAGERVSMHKSGFTVTDRRRVTEEEALVAS